MRFFWCSFLVVALCAPRTADASLMDALRYFARICVGYPLHFDSEEAAAKFLYLRMNELGLSQRDRQILAEWPAGGVSRRVNGALRANEQPDRNLILGHDPEFTQGDMLDLIDSLKDRTKLKQPIVAYRGVGALDIGPVQVGDVVGDDGYMNMTLTPKYAHFWGKYNSPRGYKILELTFPAGYSLVPVGHVRAVAGEVEAGELCMVPPKGTKYRVTGTHVDDNGVTHIEGVVIP
jgi:hypothetical protein